MISMDIGHSVLRCLVCWFCRGIRMMLYFYLMKGHEICTSKKPKAPKRTSRWLQTSQHQRYLPREWILYFLKCCNIFIPEKRLCESVCIEFNSWWSESFLFTFWTLVWEVNTFDMTVTVATADSLMRTHQCSITKVNWQSRVRRSNKMVRAKVMTVEDMRRSESSGFTQCCLDTLTKWKEVSKYCLLSCNEKF